MASRDLVLNVDIFSVCRVLEDYMNKRVKYIITCERWDDNFEEVRYKAELSRNTFHIFVDVKGVHEHCFVFLFLWKQIYIQYSYTYNLHSHYSSFLSYAVLCTYTSNSIGKVTAHLPINEL